VAGSPRRTVSATIVPMGQLLLFVVVALVVAAIVFGVTVMVSGGDSGLTPVEPDGRAVPLPSDRPLGEEDVVATKFDTAFRGYRMSQVDQALQRAAYDIGYKGELIGVLEAEVAALREGRIEDADVLRRAREAAVAPPPAPPAAAAPDSPAAAGVAGSGAAGSGSAGSGAAGSGAAGTGSAGSGSAGEDPLAMVADAPPAAGVGHSGPPRPASGADTPAAPAQAAEPAGGKDSTPVERR
jgi:DivIVA domain-containing protein